MKFTNTDCVGEDIYWYFLSHAYDQVNEQVYEQVYDQVYVQVLGQVYDQIIQIPHKIHQEKNK